MRGMSVGGLAAGLAVAVGVMWGGGRTTAASELLKALDNQAKAKSFRAVVKTTLADPPAGAKPSPDQRVFYQGEKTRMEMGDLTVVGDGATGELLMLDARAKVAHAGTADVVGRTDLAKGVTAGVRKVLDAQGDKDKATPVPAVEIGGKKRSGFKVSGVPFGPGQTADVVFYLDDERRLPLRYELTVSGPVKMTSVMEFLAYDEELDPKLFSLDVPAGYKQEELKLPAAPTPGKTRPVSLKLAAEAMAAAPCMVSVLTNTFEDKPERPALSSKTYIRGTWRRVETLNPGGDRMPDPKQVPVLEVAVWDTAGDQGAFFDLAARTVRFPKRRGPIPATVPDAVAQFRDLKDEAAVAGGEEKVGDVTAGVLVLKGVKFGDIDSDEVRVWLDPRTSLPVRVRQRFTDATGRRTHTYDRFEWPAKLDDALFSVAVPKGYTLVEDKPAKK